MEYALLEITYTNKDDGQKRGLVGMKVDSIEQWEAQIRENVEKAIDRYTFSISHSDNVSDDFDDVDEVMSKITITKVTPEEFAVLARFVNPKATRDYALKTEKPLDSFKIGAVPYNEFNYKPEELKKAHKIK